MKLKIYFNILKNAKKLWKNVLHLKVVIESVLTFSKKEDIPKKNRSFLKVKELFPNEKDNINKKNILYN